MNIIIRNCSFSDLERLYEIESLSYPVEEGASFESLRKRLQAFSNHFWGVEVDGLLVSFVNGLCTDEKHLADWMYEEAERHDEKGGWQMVFSVVCHPNYRHNGYPRLALGRLIEEARKDKRKGLVLTCKERLIPYYSSFGFVDEGVSESTHGGVVWHEMRLSF